MIQGRFNQDGIINVITFRITFKLKHDFEIVEFMSVTILFINKIYFLIINIEVSYFTLYDIFFPIFLEIVVYINRESAEIISTNFHEIFIIISNFSQVEFVFCIARRFKERYLK